MPEQTKILAVVVLYGLRAEESPAYCSLTQAMSGRGDGAIELIVCDNTPVEQPAPAGFLGRYLRDTGNPGLAPRYNQAHGIAVAAGAPWLMLLDQDTTVTPAYLDEAVSAARVVDGELEVVALVPRLLERGVVCSPIVPASFQAARPVDAQASGVAQARLHAFNSGAVLRVRAVQGIGGFPEDFPLDYLDHATFTQLQSSGGKLFLLNAMLEHELSSNDNSRRDPAFARRQQTVLDAEYRFYNRYGGVRDRLLRRLRLLRGSAGRLVRGKDRAQTWRMLKSAIRL